MIATCSGGGVGTDGVPTKRRRGDMFRCPTCIAVLAEPRARRCETCGQNLRRREPFVLGDATRVSSLQLPIDRWMAERSVTPRTPLRPVPSLPGMTVTMEAP